MRERRRAQDGLVHDAEHGRRGPDAERERRNHQQGIAGPGAEAAHGDANVVGNRHMASAR
ncbi:MAG: hypothetical protein H0W08_21515 [Acidobacteria bacterium]|nr:hypothetical protein [Acidobacteriota bacterium]